MGIGLGQRPPELAFPALMAWKSGKLPGIPNAPGTDWDVPLTVGGVSPYAQGPLPPQPPVEVLSNGEFRLVPSVPQPKYVPPALAAIQAMAQPKTGFPFNYPPQPGSYPGSIPVPMPGWQGQHARAMAPQRMAFNPEAIVAGSQGMPPQPKPQPAKGGGATMNGQPITLASVLSMLQRPSVRRMNDPNWIGNQPTPQALSGTVSQDYNRLADPQAEAQRLRLLGL